MNMQEACVILGISDISNLNYSTVRRKYHAIISDIHPDNNDGNVSIEVYKVNEAYIILKDYIGSKFKAKSYSEMKIEDVVITCDQLCEIYSGGVLVVDGGITLDNKNLFNIEPTVMFDVTINMEDGTQCLEKKGFKCRISKVYDACYYIDINRFNYGDSVNIDFDVSGVKIDHFKLDLSAYKKCDNTNDSVNKSGVFESETFKLSFKFKYGIVFEMLCVFNII